MTTAKCYKLKSGKVITVKMVHKHEKKGYNDATIARKLGIYPQALSNIRKRFKLIRKYPVTKGPKSGRPFNADYASKFCSLFTLLAYRRDVDESKLTPFIRSVYNEIKAHRGW